MKNITDQDTLHGLHTGSPQGFPSSFLQQTFGFPSRWSVSTLLYEPPKTITPYSHLLSPREFHHQVKDQSCPSVAEAFRGSPPLILKLKIVLWILCLFYYVPRTRGLSLECNKISGPKRKSLPL